MKKKICFSIIIFLLVLLAYVTNITNTPESYIVFEGQNFEYKGILGLEAKTVSISNNNKLDEELLDDSSNGFVDTSSEGTVELQISAFGIPVKEVSINILPKTTVIPLGNTIGVKLYTNGVLIVGKSTIEGNDKNLYRPYENSDIKEGDMIIEINEEEITSTNDLVDVVNESEGKELRIKYRRGESINTTSIIPVQTSADEYKLGLWVRDGTAGVGTLTFYEHQSNQFAALGHGITDVDTSQLLDISKGELLLSKIVSIKKGESGNPGEIRGTIANQEELGRIYKNTEFGIYGELSNIDALKNNNLKEYEVASREEIKNGDAKIICSLENGATKEYDIKIQKIYKNNTKDNKSMIIKIEDEELIKLTGGIIQGMSGSPIIQNGKFVGAVTHVLVNDPTRGYAVFADIMLSQMK